MVSSSEDLWESLFTTTLPVKSGEWHFLGTESLTAIERTMTKRIVGGDVWVGDSCVGPASDQDYLVLMNMRVKGSEVIEKIIADFK